MITASISLQDLRRKIYVKAKADQSWRFWGKPETPGVSGGTDGVGVGCTLVWGYFPNTMCAIQLSKVLPSDESHKLLHEVTRTA